MLLVGVRGTRHRLTRQDRHCIQLPQAASFDTLSRGEFHHPAGVRTYDDQVEATTIKTREYHRQNALGAADSSGVVVEQNLQNGTLGRKVTACVT